MKLPATARVVATLGGVVALAVVLVQSLGVVHWTSIELTDVTLASTAGVALIGATLGHLRRDTAPEPVALSATLTGFVGAMIVVGNVFAWWSLSDSATASILAAVAVIGGGGLAAAARQTVTPINPPRT